MFYNFLNLLGSQENFLKCDKNYGGWQKSCEKSDGNTYTTMNILWSLKQRYGENSN